MGDTKDNRLSCDELEQLVPELLYGELDEARAAEVREQLPACELDGKVAAYERMREAFRSLPDEEPPPAITAQLLHAAAKQVEGKSPDAAGFWDKMRAWFAPLFMHPGVAAAASILVIGGVVGVLYLKGSDQIAQPDVASRATAPELREPAPAAPAGTVPTFEDSLDDTIADAEEANEQDEDRAAEAPAAVERKPAPKRSKKKRASKRRGRDLENDKAGFDATGQSTGLIGGEGGRSDEGAKLGDTVGPVTRGKSPPPPPPAEDPAPAPEPEPAPDDAPQAEKKAPQTRAPGGAKDKPDPHAAARRLHSQARSAAEKGDCTSARKLAARIQKSDPTYYRDEVRDDRQLRKCQNVGK